MKIIKFTLIASFLTLFIFLMVPASSATSPLCDPGEKPPCTPDPRPTRIHPTNDVVIDVTQAGLRITHPNGILIDITGAGYLCTGELITGSNNVVTTCSSDEPSDIVITDTRSGVESSFDTDGGYTITVNGLSLDGKGNDAMTEEIVFFVDPSGFSITSGCGTN